MGMRWVETELRASVDPKDAERADLISVMLKSRGKDISLPSEEAAIQAKIESERHAKRQYRTVFTEYQSNQHTPEFLTSTWQTIYTVWSKDQNLGIEEIPPCDRTLEEIQELENKGRMVFYLPQELYEWGNGYFLETRKANAEHRNFVSTLKDVNKLHGWLDIDAGADASYMGTSEAELKEIIEPEGRVGANVNAYVVSSIFCKKVSGLYLDENGTKSRLLGTTMNNNGAVIFYYQRGGPFGVKFSSNPNEKNQKLGGRSVGYRKVT